MELIKKEFEEYLQSVVATYEKPTSRVFANPSSLNKLRENSRDFNAKANAKIQELSDMHNIPEIDLKSNLSSIIVQYSTKIISGHL
jgi:hypothetical protein